ncbi:hypothetical protein MJO28_001533, partial [Puccinia striiformis f. sp. tritici]
MIEEVSIIHANRPILDCLQLDPSLEQSRLHIPSNSACINVYLDGLCGQCAFKKEMSKEPLNPAQQCSYKMRIEINPLMCPLKPGHLVILDHLRDPFTHSSLVIASFKIIVGLFVQQRMETGKYLNSDPCPKRFTDSMTSLIRQQQHFGFRTIILTQEPTVVPDVILDLVSFLVPHRFNSPTWIKHLSKHISVNQDRGKSE